MLHMMKPHFKIKGLSETSKKDTPELTPNFPPDEASDRRPSPSQLWLCLRARTDIETQTASRHDSVGHRSSPTSFLSRPCVSKTASRDSLLLIRPTSCGCWRTLSGDQHLRLRGQRTVASRDPETPSHCPHDDSPSICEEQRDQLTAAAQRALVTHTHTKSGVFSSALVLMLCWFF